MDTVEELLNLKGRDIYSIGPSESVHVAAAQMMEHQIHALTVIDENNSLVGIISERDCVQKVLLKELPARDTSVSEVMTRDVFVVKERTLITTCMSLMNQKDIRHLPVMSHDVPVGMITPDDVFQSLLKEQTLTIEELESCIFEERGGES